MIVEYVDRSTKRMAREIPGFVYDEEKGKYFRIQENHRNAQHAGSRSIQAATKYTREAVEGQKRLRQSHSVPERKKHKSGVQQKTIPGSSRKQHRCLDQEIVLRLRLRDPKSLSYHDTARALISRQYARSLTLEFPVAKDLTGKFGIFLIDPDTRDLFTTTTLDRNRAEEFCVTPISQGHDETRKPRKSVKDGSLYRRADTVSILDSPPLAAAAVSSTRLPAVESLLTSL